MEIVNNIIDWIKGINLTVDQIFLIVVSIFLFFGFLKGLTKGLWKSLFYAIMTPIMIYIAYLCTPLLTEFLKTLDISWLNLKLEGYPINSIIELPAIIEVAYPQIGQYLVDSNITYTVIEIVFASINLSVFLTLVWLIWAFGWIIQGLLYHLVFKRFIPKVIRKKKFRLLGGVFGAVRAFVVISVMLLPYAMVDGISRAADLKPSGTNEIEEMSIKISQAYGDSFIGTFMKLLKINGQPLDQSMLNHITKMKINQQTTSLNQELQVFAKTYNIFADNNIIEFKDGQVTFNAQNLTSETIDELVDTLFDSKILGQSIGDVMIIGLNGLESQDVIELDAESKTEFISKIKAIIDWKEEVKHFAEIYKELVDENGKFVTDFTLVFKNDAKVNVIAENISSSIIFKSAFPLVVQTGISNLKDQDGNPILNLTVEEKTDIVNSVKNITDYKKEILSFVNIYKTLVDDDGKFISDINLVLNDDDKVDVIATSISDSTIVKSSFPIIVNLLLDKMVDSNGNAFINLTAEQKTTLINKIKLIDDYKTEVNSFVDIYRVLLDDDGKLPSDFMSLLKDEVRVEIIAASIDDSTIISSVLPVLLSTALDSASIKGQLTNFGIDTEKFDLYSSNISWGNEIKVLSSALKEIDNVDMNNLDKEVIVDLVSSLKDSTIISPQLPGVVDALVSKVSEGVDLNQIDPYIHLTYLAGLMEYDLNHDTDYFDTQLDGILTIFDSISNTNFELSDSTSFVPVLTKIRDMENSVKNLASIDINEYKDGVLLGQVTAKPTIIAPQALINLVKSITDQAFVKNVIGNDAVNTMNYQALYDDNDEIARLGDIVAVLLSNNSGNILNGDDALVAANLNLITSSSLLKPVLPSLIETQMNTLLGASRSITVLESDLTNIDWSVELAAIRHLQNVFVEGTAVDSLDASKFETLFSKVRTTNLVHKIVVNELNSYTQNLGASYVWSKDKLTSKQSATLGKLMDFKNLSIPSNDRTGTISLVSNFNVFDDETTYDKTLVDAILPEFIAKIDNGHTLDKSVFANSPSYTDASLEISNIIDKITAFEGAATPLEIEQRANALLVELNSAGELSSELIVHTGIKFNVPAMAQSYFAGQITNTRIASIVVYE
jgi:uncharacterized membrane protein required for colicin V production